MSFSNRKGLQMSQTQGGTALARTTAAAQNSHVDDDEILDWEYSLATLPPPRRAGTVGGSTSKNYGRAPTRNRLAFI